MPKLRNSFRIPNENDGIKKKRINIHRKTRRLARGSRSTRDIIVFFFHIPTGKTKRTFAPL